MTSIQAAVLREPGRPLRIERLELEDPRPDEVLVRLAASGICHTDIDFCESGAEGAVVLGHEGAGVIDTVGDPNLQQIAIDTIVKLELDAPAKDIPVITTK